MRCGSTGRSRGGGVWVILVLGVVVVVGSVSVVKGFSGGIVGCWSAAAVCSAIRGVSSGDVFSGFGLHAFCAFVDLRGLVTPLPLGLVDFGD